MKFTTASSTSRKDFKEHLLLKVYIIVFTLCWVMTYLNTPDRANWYTENAMTVLILAVLFFSYSKFKFSDLSYTLLFVFGLMHIYGAEYTYAENPLGYRLKELLDWDRNHYDRIVHFSFGFLLAYPLRDYFMNHFQWPVWVCWVLPCEITLSFSGMYELIEWAVAGIFFPEQGVAYLGTQGDVWDAQKDMGLAFSGAVLIMLAGYWLKRLLPR
jgi:putative membrane protein